MCLVGEFYQASGMLFGLKARSNGRPEPVSSIPAHIHQTKTNVDQNSNQQGYHGDSLLAYPA